MTQPAPSPPRSPRGKDTRPEVATFPYVVPRVQVPRDLAKTLSPDELAHLKDACLDDYKAAMKTLDEAVADVAAVHPDAQEFARTLASRLLAFMEKYTEVLLERDGKITNATSDVAKQALIDLAVNELLRQIFSKDRERDEPGHVGLNPLSIRQVFKAGNLREQMYLPYKTTWDFSHAILKDPAMVAAINDKLQTSHADWRIDAERLQQNSVPYAYKALAATTRDDGLRHDVSPQAREALVKEKNLRIDDDAHRRIPLSEREKRYATSELAPTSTRMGEPLRERYRKKAHAQIQWKPGSYWYRIQTNAERPAPHAYLTAVEAVGTPSLTGVSGTTDQILTMGMYFGLSAHEDLEKGRLACLGWMLDATDHALNEVMTASRDFGFDYTPSPWAYTQIYSQDPAFVGKLRAAQMARHSPLPDVCLSEEYARRKAEELFGVGAETT